jgi:hypothetical protein
MKHAARGGIALAQLLIEHEADINAVDKVPQDGRSHFWHHRMPYADYTLSWTRCHRMGHTPAFMLLRGAAGLMLLSSAYCFVQH